MSNGIRRSILDDVESIRKKIEADEIAKHGERRAAQRKPKIKERKICTICRWFYRNFIYCEKKST
jgi:hypothetical protein